MIRINLNNAFKNSFSADVPTEAITESLSRDNKIPALKSDLLRAIPGFQKLPHIELLSRHLDEGPQNFLTEEGTESISSLRDKIQGLKSTIIQTLSVLDNVPRLEFLSRYLDDEGLHKFFTKECQEIHAFRRFERRIASEERLSHLVQLYCTDIVSNSVKIDPDFFDDAHLIHRVAFENNSLEYRAHHVRAVQTLQRSYNEILKEGHSAIVLGALYIYFGSNFDSNIYLTHRQEKRAAATCSVILDPVELDGFYGATIRRLVEGDADNGMLLIIGQQHTENAIEAIYGEKYKPKSNIEEMMHSLKRVYNEKTAIYQFQMLHLLIALGWVNLFEEAEDGNAGGVQRNMPPDRQEIWKNYQKKKLPAFETASPEERFDIYTFGASRIYLLLNANAMLLPASSPKFKKLEGVNRLIFGKDYLSFARVAVMNRAREDFAVHRIQMFFKENPRERAILIYGLQHRDRLKQCFDALPIVERPEVSYAEFPCTRFEKYESIMETYHSMIDMLMNKARSI